MKKVVSIVAIAAVMFTMSVNAQDKVISKKQKAKTEKVASTDKKECSGKEKKGASCCAHKGESK